MSKIEEYQLFIDGEWTPSVSKERMEVINPANQQVVATVPKGTPADIDRAVESARRTFESGIWRNKSKDERAQILMNAGMAIMANKDRLAYLESLTSGGTIRRTSFVDIGSVASSLLVSAAIMRSMPDVEHAVPLSVMLPMQAYTKREPIGVCAAITPWNLPMMLAAFKFAPALAMGNSIVMKPASITPVTTLELAKIIYDAGVPAGAFNVVTGPGSSTGNRLASHPEVDKIAFTGSTEVGRNIARLAADGIKRVTLELGGKSPNIVLDDADLDSASGVAINAFLFHSGQACESGTRLIVPRKMQEALVEKMIQRIKKIKIGNQLELDTGMGPIASQEQLNTIIDYVKLGKEEGATLALGGNRLVDGEFGKGFFYEPTIFTNCNNQMRVAREEIFGPVLCVIPYDDEEEAIAIANDSPYGLGGGICSTNVTRAQKVAAQMRTGNVWINTYHVLRPDMPFGGYKQSGYGRENCYHGLLAYSEVKSVYQDLVPSTEDKMINLLLNI